jgi:hypothetical protein
VSLKMPMRTAPPSRVRTRRRPDGPHSSSRCALPVSVSRTSTPRSRHARKRGSREHLMPCYQGADSAARLRLSAPLRVSLGIARTWRVRRRRAGTETAQPLRARRCSSRACTGLPICFVLGPHTCRHRSDASRVLVRAVTPVVDCAMASWPCPAPYTPSPALRCMGYYLLSAHIR